MWWILVCKFMVPDALVLSVQWVADGSPTHSSTPVRIESALQFVPKNTDPREFKKLQQQVKNILCKVFLAHTLTLK